MLRDQCERIECRVAGVLVRTPNYSIPGMVEQVRREVFEAELRALDRIDSSTALYLLHEVNR
jgi:hypothetical protein